MNTNVKQHKFETEFYIWKTEWVIDDYEDHIIVTIPCTKSDGVGAERLSSYKEKVTNKNLMALIRKMVENDNPMLVTKNESQAFTLREVLYYINPNDWKAEEFK